MKDIREGALGSDNETGKAATADAPSEVHQDGSDTEADPELEMVLVQELLMQDDGTEVDGCELDNRAAAMPTKRPTAAGAERRETLFLLLQPR